MKQVNKNQTRWGPRPSLCRRTPNRRVASCLALCIGLFCIGLQQLQAQQTAVPPKTLPSAQKIVDSYLKAIGGKKRIATIRDATYEWQIQLKDRTMGIAKTQTKTPSSVRSELIFGNGQVVSAANPRSAWTHGLDGKPHTLTDAEAAAARLQATLDAGHLLDIKKSNVLSRVVSFTTAESGSAYVVEFSLRSGARLRYLFSATTKLLIGIEDDARKTELSPALVEQHAKRLLLLRNQHGDVRTSVAIEIPHDRSDGSRAGQEDVFAILFTAHVLKPGKPSGVVAIFAQDKIGFTVAIEVGEFRVRWPGQVRQDRLGRAEPFAAPWQKSQCALRIVGRHETPDHRQVSAPWCLNHRNGNIVEPN